MCGIAGIINHHHYNLDLVKKSLLHRGPDDQTIYVDKNLALIHTRLAIQDITKGKQPFQYERHAIIFNGEIYNHLELRKYLSEFTFKTHSDTETLLYLYIKFGESMFEKLDGMFAFCVYDQGKQELFLARDRAGKKPLYYSHYKDSFLFASELNALKSIIDFEINEEAIYSYLRAGFFYGPHTVYKNVYALEAGTSLRVSLQDQKIQIKKFFDIFDSYIKKDVQVNSFHQAALYTEHLLTKSVSDRLISSDIEVGVFLSGGIDSNLVAAMASRVQPNIKTFTVKTEGAFDESHLAALAAKKYGTQHQELTISMNLRQDIETILNYYGSPFMDSSAIPSFYVAKEAKRHVGVILNGDGADELFGGYRRYVTVTNPLIKCLSYFSSIKKILPKPKRKQSFYTYFYRLLSMAGKKNLDFYLSATTDIYEDVYQFGTNTILKQMNDKLFEIYNDTRLSALQKFLYLDFTHLLFCDLLVKMDIATMANSLEGRSPFLAADILRYVPSLPDHYKINKFTTKALLREIAKKYVPPELVSQPKRGFEVPLVKWIENDLKTIVHDYLVPGCHSERYIKRSFIQKLLHHKIPIGQEKRVKMIWNLFCLEIWHNNEAKYRTRCLV